MSRIDEILMLVKHVPPFPKVANKVMAMLDDPNVKIGELAGIIQYDPGITTNILKICNAAYFGLNRKVSSLDEALMYLGHEQLRDILITSGSAKFYKGNTGAGYELAQGDLWMHSVATAIVSKFLVKHIKGVNPSTAFTAGLLHDIGKRFLSSFVGDELKTIVEMVDVKKCSFAEAEKAVLGANHAELGGMVLESWEFAPEMAVAVRHHHDEDAVDKGPLAAAVALANVVVVSMGIGGGAEGLATKIRGKAFASLNIGVNELDSCMARLISEMEKAQDVLCM